MTEKRNTADWLQTWFGDNQDSLLKDFSTFLKFQSISTQNEHAEDMHACVDWLQERLTRIGFSCQTWETSNYPVLFAEHCQAGNDAPTVLIYNHYDVQPVDPLELWDSPPFEANLRDGEIFARGAQDNKGQCFYVLCALEALIERDGGLPVNVKLCIEGEEESGSDGLSSILEEKESQLKADHFLVIDMGIHSLEQPAITLGIRGITPITIVVEGSNSDLHSGLYGGIAYNPLHALVEVLAKARNSDGSIAIPGFYDDVQETSKEMLESIDLEFSNELYTQQTGYPPSGGEQAHSPLASAWLRPTLEINGIGGGYFGEGMKTVIPSQAVAKVSCRLVPNQDPLRIASLIKEFFETEIPGACKVSVDLSESGGPAIRSNLENKDIAATAKAITEVFDLPCRYILSGGSIPVIAAMTQVVGVEPVLFGLGLPGDNMHAPNEHFGVERLKKGCAIIGRTLELLKNES